MLTPAEYFRWFLVSAVSAFALVIAFNALVDPLGVSPLRIEIQGVNLYKPLRNNFDRLVKPYDVRLNAPRTLFVGSSLVKQSIDPTQLDTLPLAPAYNAGIDNGANMEETRRMLEYYFSVNKNIRTVYIELFLTAIMQFQSFSASAPVRELDIQAERILALISGSAFGYSVDTIRANRAAKNPPIASFDRGFVPVAAPPFRFSVDNIPDALFRNRVIDPPRKASMASVVVAQEIVDLCRRHQIDCRFFVSPLHADVLYGIYFAGLWDELVVLKKAFAQIAPTYDFTRYNDLIDERSGPLDYWWEAFHFSPALGAHMAHVMAGVTPNALPPNFGILLNAVNVDAEMQAWAAERDIWISRYPLIRARFEAARNNNSKALKYTGMLRESKHELMLGEGATYKIISKRGGAVEFASTAPPYALGWVGDPQNSKAARAVVMFQGELLVAYAEPNLPRPDLSTDKTNLLSFGGFYAPLPSVSRSRSTLPLRAFALYEDGIAAELEYASGAAGFRNHGS